MLPINGKTHGKYQMLLFGLDSMMQPQINWWRRLRCRLRGKTNRFSPTKRFVESSIFGAARPVIFPHKENRAVHFLGRKLGAIPVQLPTLHCKIVSAGRWPWIPAFSAGWHFVSCYWWSIIRRGHMEFGYSPCWLTFHLDGPIAKVSIDCFDNCAAKSEEKFVLVWFENFPSYLGRKKGTSETFLSLGLQPRPQKPFPRFPFFYLGNLGKSQIRRGQILPQPWQEQISKQNTIVHFSNYANALYRGHHLG